MNCQTAHDKLIELVYDELSGEERRAVEAHAAGCDACREELDRLRFARSALSAHYAAEPEAGAFDVAAAEGRARRRPPRVIRFPGATGRWLRAAVGVAAAAALVGGIWLLHDRTTPPAAAESGPVEIERVGVSLTILSRPDGWGGFAYGDAQNPTMQVSGQYRAQMFQTIEPMQIEINAPGGRWGQPRWRGMALVRDQRLVRRLKRGRTRVRFADVPSGILPDTVRLRSLDRPDGLAILEQDYQYDLATAAAVLRRHVDQPVTAAFKDGGSVAGTLLSFDAATLVIRCEDGPRNVARAELGGIAFARLPEGLLSRPTLVWDIENRADAKQQFEVAYLTHGLNWRADYVLKLRVRGIAAREERGKAGPREAASGPVGGPTGKGVRAGRKGPAIRNPQSAILDTADLVGYATVTNLSGTTYENAQLKLMAGDVNLIKPPVEQLTARSEAYTNANFFRGGAAVMTEKAFFEYHLYTVTRPTTLRSAETKQLEMVSGRGIKLRRGYVFDRRVNATAARVVSEMMNSKANGLGKPLPKGVVRLYAPDPEGVQTYVARKSIDHTPKDEKLRLPWGFAFDIACSARQTNQFHRGGEHRATMRYEIRNHKDYDVTVTVIERVPATTYRGECKSCRWHVREVGSVEIDVPVKAGASAAVAFAYRWNDHSGGGLRSPHDQ